MCAHCRRCDYFSSHFRLHSFSLWLFLTVCGCLPNIHCRLVARTPFVAKPNSACLSVWDFVRPMFCRHHSCNFNFVVHKHRCSAIAFSKTAIGNGRYSDVWSSSRRTALRWIRMHNHHIYLLLCVQVWWCVDEWVCMHLIRLSGWNWMTFQEWFISIGAASRRRTTINRINTRTYRTHTHIHWLVEWKIIRLFVSRFFVIVATSSFLIVQHSDVKVKCNGNDDDDDRRQQRQFIRFSVSHKNLLNIIAYLWFRLQPADANTYAKLCRKWTHLMTRCRQTSERASAYCRSIWRTTAHRETQTHVVLTIVRAQTLHFHRSDILCLSFTSSSLFRFFFYFSFHLIVCELSFSLPQPHCVVDRVAFFDVLVCFAKYRWRIPKMEMNQCTIRSTSTSRTLSLVDVLRHCWNASRSCTETSVQRILRALEAEVWITADGTKTVYLCAKCLCDVGARYT